MTFRITISRPPFAVEFEAGSVSEAIGVLEAEGTSLPKLFAVDLDGSAPTETQLAQAQGNQEAPKERKPRGPNKNKAAEPASAPAPVAIPETAAPGPDTTPNANGIPAFLDRNAQAAPPPPAPPAPPAAPPAPPAPPPAPTGVLAGKMIPVLQSKATGAVDGGQALADWLSNPAPKGCGLLKPGATFAEAMEGLRFISDERLGPVAAALGVS